MCGAILMRPVGRITRSTLLIDAILQTNAYRIASLFSISTIFLSHEQQVPRSDDFMARPIDIQIKTDTGYILAAPVTKNRLLAVIFDDLQFSDFNVDLFKLFVDDDWQDDDLHQLDPIFPRTPPKRGSAHAAPEDKDSE
jgi:hypothetical protein